jgi:hypothetical protein
MSFLPIECTHDHALRRSTYGQLSDAGRAGTPTLQKSPPLDRFAGEPGVEGRAALEASLGMVGR